MPEALGRKRLIRKSQAEDPAYVEKNGVGFFRFSRLSGENWLLHAFSSRVGGVSTGCYAQMDLGFHEGSETAFENFRRFGAAVGFDWKNAVLSDQTHTTNVRVVKKEDAGKGLIRPKDYTDVDGLITDCPGITLFTFYADCVPLYFADVRRHVIGLSHSGWRGTTGRMGAVTLRAMKDNFGTEPGDVLAAIGPSICGDCFEVGPEVVEEFRRSFGEEILQRICRPGIGDRSMIDLWEANRQVFLEAGIPAENISVTNVCTKCNPEILFSHRVTGRQRGNLAAVLEILP